MTQLPERDRPWMMRTYAGHSNARKSNELYRTNLAKGQTGLSIAFDLPTQTGYDSDDPQAHGEVGKVGVPVSHIGDMELLLDQIPLDQMNTSMTINGTAMWLLALYIAAARRRGIDADKLAGTTQNDILKEFLARGTYIFPPKPSIKLTTDMFVDLIQRVPRWNPMNVCSYHLQEAGATPAQEIGFAMANACQVLDTLQSEHDIPHDTFEKIVGRFSFFVNAGIRFVEELCKMRAFTEMWDEITQERYGVTNEKFRRFRYGVQVNSLGLTAVQPENNVQRIVLEMLAVSLSRKARARAIQLPAWNEALGLPRPWDQQWSLRLQQVLAYETDLLEYPDLFDGNPVIEDKVTALKAEARSIMEHIFANGGAANCVDWMKSELVHSHAQRIQSIEAGEVTIVGLNKFTTSEDSPLTADIDDAIMTVDDADVREQLARLQQHKDSRNADEVQAALERLQTEARNGTNLMEASIAAAEAGVTTGEWSATLREVYGVYRAPTGIESQSLASSAQEETEALRARVREINARMGRPLKMLVGKPGLDGHSNGAEQIAVRGRDIGLEVVYEGIRLTPAEITKSAVEEGVHIVGLSILSGSHLELLPGISTELDALGQDKPVLVAGGIIPPADATVLQQKGFDAIFTPADYSLDQIFEKILGIAAERFAS